MADAFLINRQSAQALRRVIRENNAGRLGRKRGMQRRRRVFQGAPGKSSLSAASFAIFLNDVTEAVTFTTASSVDFTPGIVGADPMAKLGALMLRWSNDGSRFVEDTSIGEEGWVDAVNLTFTTIRASEDEPVVMMGYYEEFDVTLNNEQVTLKRFIAGDKDFRSLPGFTLDKTRAIVPYSDDGDRKFQLDYDEC